MEATRNLPVSNLVFVLCVICVYVELWRVEIKNNIIRVVKYEYDEYFKL